MLVPDPGSILREGGGVAVLGVTENVLLLLYIVSEWYTKEITCGRILPWRFGCRIVDDQETNSRVENVDCSELSPGQ